MVCKFFLCFKFLFYISKSKEEHNEIFTLLYNVFLFYIDRTLKTKHSYFSTELVFFFFVPRLTKQYNFELITFHDYRDQTANV